MKVLVAGCAGFIGRTGFAFRRGDICDTESLRAVFRDNDRSGPVALNDISSMIEVGVGRSDIVQHRERHPADPMITWADIGRAGRLLGWTPTVDIEEGIRRTVGWYMSNRNGACVTGERLPP